MEEYKASDAMKALDHRLVDILGSTWRIEYANEGDDHGLEDADGYTDRSTRTIVLRSKRPAEERERGALQDMQSNDRNTKRHELVHAFLFESGLDAYAQDETLVSWIAHQFPKMMQALAFCGGLARPAIQAALDAEYAYALRERGEKQFNELGALPNGMMYTEAIKQASENSPMSFADTAAAFEFAVQAAHEATLEEAEVELDEPATGIEVPEHWHNAATFGNATMQGLIAGINTPNTAVEQAVRKMVEDMYGSGAVIKREANDEKPMTIDEVMQHWQATNEVQAVDKREALKEEDRFMQEYQPDPEMSILLKANYEVNGLRQYIEERERRKLLHEATELYRPGHRLEIERMLVYQHLANNNCSQHEIVSVFNTAVMTSKFTEEQANADQQ